MSKWLTIQEAVEAAHETLDEIDKVCGRAR